MCVCVRERESVCVCVCERERECVCVLREDFNMCVRMYIHSSTHNACHMHAH